TTARPRPAPRLLRSAACEPAYRRRRPRPRDIATTRRAREMSWGIAPRPGAVLPSMLPPRAQFRAIAATVLALVGLAISAALLVDSLRPAPTFCAAGGCGEVRASAWSHPLGVPMPLVGVIFFALVLALGCVDAPRARRAVALLGGAGAVALLALQGVVIGSWCRLCVATDLAAILHAALVIGGRA